MEVVAAGLQGTITVCAQPGLHYRSKSTGGWGHRGYRPDFCLCVGGVAASSRRRKGVGGGKGCVRPKKAAKMTSMNTFL